MAKRDPEPRLLTQGQAAAYCGVCVAVFKKACPVAPLNLLDRLPRYDRHALDAWINRLTKSPAEDDLDLVRMFNGRDGDSRAGA
jgi:hypothetical protein